MEVAVQHMHVEKSIPMFYNFMKRFPESRSNTHALLALRTHFHPLSKKQNKGKCNKFVRV